MTNPWGKIRVVVLRAFAHFYLEVLIGSVLLVLLAGYWWFLRHGFNEVKNVGRYNLVSSQTYEAYLSGYLNDLWTLNARLEKFDAVKVGKLSAMLPPEPDLPGLFVQMAAIAEASDLVVHTVNFTEPQARAAEATPGAFSSLDVSLAVSGGDYAALKNYLANLEDNLRIIDVQSVNFANQSDGPYAIQLKVYYLPR